MLTLPAPTWSLVSKATDSSKSDGGILMQTATTFKRRVARNDQGAQRGIRQPCVPSHTHRTPAHAAPSARPSQRIAQRACPPSGVRTPGRAALFTKNTWKLLWVRPLLPKVWKCSTSTGAPQNLHFCEVLPWRLLRLAWELKVSVAPGHCKPIGSVPGGGDLGTCTKLLGSECPESHFLGGTCL